MVAKRHQPYELLIADDDPAFRETLRSVLEPRFRLVEATCGEEAIEIVEKRPVDLALLDMHMRVLTGLDTLRIVKTLRSLLPCILVTADATDELRRDAALAEAYTVLSKPVLRSELVTTVSTALRSAYDDDEIDEWNAGTES